ncbi:MAG: hypothetical protein OXU61_10870 [Gammaproteobacteria bacterium]|nr:hypothetical protein [Gammaproteobacteria bacterium]
MNNLYIGNRIRGIAADAPQGQEGQGINRRLQDGHGGGKRRDFLPPATGIRCRDGAPAPARQAVLQMRRHPPGAAGAAGCAPCRDANKAFYNGSPFRLRGRKAGNRRRQPERNSRASAGNGSRHSLQGP